jgi:hypothetical protein
MDTWRANVAETCPDRADLTVMWSTLVELLRALKK